MNQGTDSNKYTAEFNIIDVVKTLFELRSKLKTQLTIEGDDTGKLIAGAIVQAKTDNQDEEIKE